MFLLLCAPAAQAASIPELESDTERATAGFFQLDWSLPEGEADTFRLERSPDADFREPRLIYEGPDRARLISGLENGDYYYRVRAELSDGSQTNWSEPVEVTVAHHSLARAFGFFGVGAVVFVATMLVIVVGTRQAEEN